MSRRSRLYQSAFTVGSWTLLSRLTGFFRDIVIAALFGSGPIAEAFQVAFSLPNLFRRLFAEGTINAAFVPIFSKSLSNRHEAAEFARNTFSWLTTALIVLTVAAQAAMPWFVLAIASGFRDDGRFDLAVDFGRICFPYILFIALASLLSGILNSFGRFAAGAAAPVLLNVILLGAMGLALASGIDPGPALAWGVPVAGVAQLALMWLACRRTGIRMALHVPRLTPKVRRLAVVAFPAVLAGGVVQINILVGRQVASYFDGAIQWLAVADRLYQLPLGVVGIATGIVLLPELMRRLAEGDHEGSRDAFNRATEFALMLTIPAAFALVVIPFPLVSVLFERGAFTTDDSHATAAALAVYGIGLPAFVLQKTLQPLYFSGEDTRTPFRFAVFAMLANAVLAIGLIPLAGYLAAAVGTTLSSWLMFFLLWNGRRHLGEMARVDRRLRSFTPRALLASAFMAVVVFALADLLLPWLTADGIRYAALAIIVMAGAAAYFGAAIVMKAISLAELREVTLNRRLPGDHFGEN